MKAFMMALLFLISVTLLHAKEDEPSPAIGTWEGESICTVPSSPCHDEHVIYEIAPDPKVPDKLNASAYKVVEGEKQFMGTLNCAWQKGDNILSCTSKGRYVDDWEFHVTAKEMTGTLVIGKERQLYRKVSVTKK
jgi:hypothetical protein